jgi:two-component system cell cycle response regulator DivK
LRRRGVIIPATAGLPPPVSRNDRAPHAAGQRARIRRTLTRGGTHFSGDDVALIFVAEDNPVNLTLMRAVLEPMGHTVSAATNCAEARALLARSQPDLIILDIQLPGGDGAALLRDVRADPRLAALPVMAVTAFAMSGDRERFLEQGFDHYVSKPLNIRAFRELIEKTLRGG